ncbi:hypothetical protein HDV05_005722 [Chytridiales sp. JEL 0842]|nr:hypothetical protein HDV05_005722 [Chytridiales sp. JEL 0842]
MSGCAVCVWDLYKEQVEKFNDTLRKLGREEEMVTEEELDPSLKAFMELERSKGAGT